jgi:hypothetical protein
MKLYTVAEARALLPRVIPVLESLREAYVEMRAVQASVAALSRGASGDGHLLVDPWEDGRERRMETLDGQVRQAAAALDSWGIEVKDVARGLIDFYHEREGRVVFLCYLLGEPTLGYWHELEAGFAGRHPLD